MQIRKWLALLVSAALALSLLAGCGNGESVARSLLNLLDGKYANVSVEMDPDLEADLRQAVHEGETDAEIRAALEKILGSGASFRLIGDGQQGDTAWNLILYPGSDPDAAARSAFTEWNKVFGSLPRDGQYSAGLAMLETENGYAILVQATVDKAASRDDDDDEPEDEKVEGNGFTYNVTKKTITVEANSGETNGLQELFFDADVNDKVKAARADGFAGVTITLAANTTYTVSQTFAENNGTFKGTLKGEDKKTTIIKLTDGSNGLFQQIGKEDDDPDDNGKVENITFDVQTAIINTYAAGVEHCAGAVAGLNNGTIQNCDVTINGGSISATDDSCYAGAVAGSNNGTITDCDVTINSDYTIQATTSSSSFADAGGLVGYNDGTITNCTVTINGSISATSGSTANAGGIAGDNQRLIGNSQVTLNGGTITAMGEFGDSAGGLAGQNAGTVTDDCTPQIKNLETITAQAGLSDDTYNDTASVPYTDNTDTYYIKTDGNARAGTRIGFEWRAEDGGGPVGS